MSKLYCTACGEESNKKVCEKCGVKKNAVHKFCEFCGEALNERATICTNCKESVKGEPIFWNILNILCAFLPLGMLLMSIGEGQPFMVILFFALSFVLCLPFVKTIIRQNTVGKQGLRRIIKIVRVVAIFACLSMGFNCIPTTEPETLTTEEAYEAIIGYAETGNYAEAEKIAINYPEVVTYGDTELYLTYCDALKAYNAGGIGNAYEMFLTVPEILDAQMYIVDLQKEIGMLDGVYVEDNEEGSYQYLVIEEGKVHTEIVAYGDYVEDYKYDFAEDHYSYIVKGKFDDGTDYYAIGRYSEYDSSVDASYVMYLFPEDNQIMLMVFEGEEYSTFNGLYDKIR